MEENVAQSVAQPRFGTILSTIFAMVALVIAAVGIYGVMAYALLQRSREIGIRMALGCSSEGIFLLILNDGMRLTGIGVIIGTTLGLVVARSLKSLLFGISSTDGVTLATSIVVVLGVGLLASFLPARRASESKWPKLCAKASPFQFVRTERRDSDPKARKSQYNTR